MAEENKKNVDYQRPKFQKNSLLTERVHRIERILVAECNAVVFELVVRDIEFAANAKQEAFMAENAGQIKQRAAKNGEICIQLQNLNIENFLSSQYTQIANLDILVLPFAFYDGVALARVRHVDRVERNLETARELIRNLKRRAECAFGRPFLGEDNAYRSIAIRKRV